jgi:SPP1 gp7 family putative phage head morphogenesis protein
VLKFTVAFNKVLRRHLNDLALEILKEHEKRSDAVASPLMRLFGRLAVHFGDLLSDDLVLLMQGLVDQTALFGFEQMGLIWRKALGLPYAESPGMVAKIATYQKRNTGLIKTLTKAAIDRVKVTVEENQGESVLTMQKALQEDVGVSASHGRFLARDQILKLNGQLTKDRQEDAGITKYEWVTSGDERVRPMHRALGGKEFSWDEPPKVSKDGRHEHPGGDYQCRCVANPILDLASLKV